MIHEYHVFCSQLNQPMTFELQSTYGLRILQQIINILCIKFVMMLLKRLGVQYLGERASSMSKKLRVASSTGPSCAFEQYIDGNECNAPTIEKQYRTHTLRTESRAFQTQQIMVSAATTFGRTRKHIRTI